MKTTVTESDFVNAFDACGRKDQFSRCGRRALFEYLTEIEEESGEEMEFDCIALCCDFSEYSSAVEAAECYDFTKDPGMREEENEEAALAYLQDNTQVITHAEGIIIAAF